MPVESMSVTAETSGLSPPETLLRWEFCQQAKIVVALPQGLHHVLVRFYPPGSLVFLQISFHFRADPDVAILDLARVLLLLLLMQRNFEK